jgi:pyridinium-3,5-bisthiocarboxylic acid mononucleotide nickel chelatase
MIAYLDLPSGLSGDMFLGCLVDAGWPVDRLRATISALALDASEWSVSARTVMKGSIRATFVEVHAVEGHHHRHLADIRRIIDAGTLTETIKRRAVAVFDRLAAAEARVHGTTAERIHFHEVGAVDAIIDIVGVSAGLEELGVDRLFASSVPLGEGWASTAHGEIPLPAPATLELLAAVHAPTRPAPGPGEWVTPTGAALVAELAAFGQPAVTLGRVGIGAGSRDTAWPNVARLWLGEAEGPGAFVQIDTNIDDMNPQLFAAATERLFAAGARDVWLTPVQMKKGRPGVVLSVIAFARDEAQLADILLRETTTLGVRVHPLAMRHEARRDVQEVATAYGPVRVKVKWLEGEPLGASPEYDDCARAAAAHGVSTRTVYEAALGAARELVDRLARPNEP